MSNTDIVIRLMSVDDYSQVAELWASTPYMGMDPIDDSLAGITRFLAHNPNLNFIAEYQNKIIGVLMCGYDGRRATLYHMAVDEKFQRQGVGKKLLYRLEQELLAQGITQARLLVFKNNIIGNCFWQNAQWQLREDLNYYSRPYFSSDNNEKC